jgi:hypothetical protein
MKRRKFIFSGSIFQFDWLKVVTMANYNYALQQKKIFVRFGQTIFLSWIKFNLFFQKSKISKKKKINQKYSQM